MEEMTKKNNKEKKASFLTSVKNEALKITWPTGKSLKSNAKLVVLSIFIFGLAIYCVDLFVNNFLSVLSSLAFRLIG